MGENDKGRFYRSWDLVEYWNMCRNWSKENGWFHDGARRKDSQAEVSWIWWLRARVGGKPGWHEVLGVGWELRTVRWHLCRGGWSKASRVELTLDTDNDQQPVCVPVSYVPGAFFFMIFYHHVYPYYNISNLPLTFSQPWEWREEDPGYFSKPRSEYTWSQSKDDSCGNGKIFLPSSQTNEVRPVMVFPPGR